MVKGWITVCGFVTRCGGTGRRKGLKVKGQTTACGFVTFLKSLPLPLWLGKNAKA